MPTIVENGESAPPTTRYEPLETPAPAAYDRYDYGSYTPAPVIPPAGPVYLGNTGSGFGTIPDLEEAEDEEKSWWSKIGSFFMMMVIIVALPILYPVVKLRELLSRRNREYEEVGSVTRVPSRVDLALAYVASVPRMAYHHLLLRLPSLYFTRVARIFEEADLSLNDLKTMALESASKHKHIYTLHYRLEISARKLPPAYESLKHTWEDFISSLLREWKTFNLISVLLLRCALLSFSN